MPNEMCIRDRNFVQAANTESEPENYKKNGKTEQIPIDNEFYYVELLESREGNLSYETDGLNATAKDLAGFINSVKTNGGYYIARYEASFASGDNINNYKAASKESIKFSEDNMNYTEGCLLYTSGLHY